MVRVQIYVGKGPPKKAKAERRTIWLGWNMKVWGGVVKVLERESHYRFFRGVLPPIS